MTDKWKFRIMEKQEEDGTRIYYTCQAKPKNFFDQMNYWFKWHYLNERGDFADTSYFALDIYIFYKKEEVKEVIERFKEKVDNANRIEKRKNVVIEIVE